MCDQLLAVYCRTSVCLSDTMMLCIVAKRYELQHCVVKCLRTWLMISILSPKATNNPFGLPLITCVVPHTHNSFGDSCRSANLEQSAMWPANTWHQLLVNILKHYWRHICLTKPRRFVTFYISTLEILLLTYLQQMCLNKWIGSAP